MLLHRGGGWQLTDLGRVALAEHERDSALAVLDRLYRAVLATDVGERERELELALAAAEHALELD